MSGGIERDEAALWRRWRDGTEAATEPAAEPDAMLLAAYAEGRRSRPGGDPESDPEIVQVEAWLADHPERLVDIVAARQQQEATASEKAVARAAALITAPGGNVVSLRSGRPASAWREAFTWSGLAASLVVACLMGFSVGSSNLIDLAGPSQTQTLVQEFIGVQTPILDIGDLDNGI
ncbi:MAG: hypothetical protein ACREFD_18865 [Stellaceae bacterium]